ncbi:MAG: N-acetylneuraminate synthase family protein [Candidatus Coatesbacteria bacterium]|nr:N-acetylneuraminate synthase family protein [Candidatus Coatesbacteria bacterium]
MGNTRLSMEMSKALIDVAVNAKADAVKFQLFNSKSLYVEEAGKAGYLSKRIKKESINEIIRSIELPTEIIKDISEYCSEKNIELMITPFSVDEAVIVNKYVKRHKLASAEITHIRLIEYMANTKKPVIISTGGASIEEIEWTVNHFYRNSGKDIAIMHCLLDYPAKPDSLNLNIIKGLKEHFCLKVGLSDHSLSFESVPVAAVSLGARIIEKHFTLSRKLPGPDNFYSLEPEELKKMVCLIRETEQILGKSIKTVQKNEFKLREFAQRSIQAITNIRKGELFKEGVNIGILRSGNKTKGIHPKFIADLEGKEARRNIRAGEGIMEEDK